MPKVAHIMNLDIGLKIHLRNQLLYLKQQGYDVYAVCSPGSLVTQDGTTADGIPVKLVEITSAITPFEDVRALVELVRYFRSNRFDIIHTHTMKAGLLGQLAATLARVPVIIHTLHGFYFYEGMGAIAHASWKRLEKLKMALGNYTLSQNHADEVTAIKERICAPDRISYLGNGIDLEAFNPSRISREQMRTKRQELGVLEGEKVVAIAGRLLVEKGYLEFFEAARLIRQRDKGVRFWAIGASQPSRQGAILLTDMRARGLDQNVSFLGMRSDMTELLAAVDVFVLPTHGREGVPRVLMEASAMGRPVVATDVRGCREAVINGQTGLLVPARNATALAEAVLTLLNNSDFANRLGAAARVHALGHFDERVYFERIHAIYQQLLDRQSSRIGAKAYTWKASSR